MKSLHIALTVAFWATAIAGDSAQGQVAGDQSADGQVAIDTGDAKAQTKKENNDRRSLLSGLLSSGPLALVCLAVLLGLSLATTYVAFDLGLSLRRGEMIPPKLGEQVRAALADRKPDDALAACEAQPSSLAAVIGAGLAESGQGWPRIEKASEDAAASEQSRLFRRIELLRVAGHLAPLVGLLGSAAILMRAFGRAADDSSATSDLAAGMYLSVVPTLIGLMIAIGAIAAYAWLRYRLDALLAEIVSAAAESLSPLKSSAAPALPAPPPPPASRK